MLKRLLTFLVCATLLLPSMQSGTGFGFRMKATANPSVRETRLWCGLIDPELSRWLARIPMEEKAPLFWQWDWSWQGFLSSLFLNSNLTEGTADVPIL